MQNFRPLESKSVHRLLRSLVEKPENFVAHLRQCVVIFPLYFCLSLSQVGLINGVMCGANNNSMAGAIILAIAFGIDVKSEDDPHVDTAEKGLGALLVGTMPQAAMYDFFPIRMF